MIERIAKLTELTLSGQMYVTAIPTEFDCMDLLLSEQQRDVKRICEYILNQQPKMTPWQAMSGMFTFDGSVVGDMFTRNGHRNTGEFMRYFYVKNLENLSAMDWQHGTSDYHRVLEVGVPGILSDIDASLGVHSEPEEVEFLQSLRKIGETFLIWMEKTARLAAEYGNTLEEPAYRANYEKLSRTLRKLTQSPPETFYEAVLTIYVTFSMNPDSFGTLDRYLTRFYDRDMEAGILTREEAWDYLQELYLMVQAFTPITSGGFTKGGQSHFCVGGRDRNGRDCCNAVTKLIVESLLDLPTYIPQVTFRWTQDTPREVLRYFLDLERKDPNKRIAFTNDDKRVEAYTKICGFPYEEAVNYTLVGCNEPAMLGGMCGSTSHGNMAHSIDTVMHQRQAEVLGAETFEDFYAIFKDQLYRDLDRIYDYDDQYNLQRAKDINYVSCLFMNGCIEKAKTATRGGVNYAVSTIMFLGNVTMMDSVCIVKQFVYDEKRVSMAELIRALEDNWEGHEELRAEILRRGQFFGNDDALSNAVSRRIYDDLYAYVSQKRTVLGYPVLLGDHTGYPLHFKWFGETTGSTPDGRRAGEPLSYGIFQNDRKARNGLIGQMNAISQFDAHGISSATVTNFNLDDSYVKNQEYFEKTVDMLETFFKNGGMQFQLNYYSADMLREAKKNPDKYRNLRVRVTGYSDFFTRLAEPIQDSIIRRCER